MSFLLSRVAAWRLSRRLARAALTPVIDRGDGPDPYAFGPPGAPQRP